MQTYQFQMKNYSNYPNFGHPNTEFKDVLNSNGI